MGSKVELDKNLHLMMLEEYDTHIEPKSYKLEILGKFVV